MKRNSISLCLFVSFVVLSICTAFFDIPKKVFISISLSSLLYAISQTVKYHIDFMNEDTKAQIDAFNVVQGINMDSLSLFLMKRYSEWIIPTEDMKAKAKKENICAFALECGAVVILLLGIILPIPWLNNDRIGNVATMLSFSFVFLSISQVEKYAERKSQWEEVVMFCAALKGVPQTEAAQKELEAQHHGE